MSGPNLGARRLAVAALATLLLADASWARAERVRVGHAAFDLPEGFVRLPSDACEGSSALIPLVGERARREILACFSEDRAEGATALVVGSIDRTFAMGPLHRDLLASGVAAHFRQELDLEVTVDRPQVVTGSRSPRVEVRATTRIDGSARVVRYAFFPGSGETLMLAASVPEASERSREQGLVATLNSFEASFPELDRAPDSKAIAVRVAALGTAGALLVLVLRVRRSARAG
jgi:hypothetical protein